MNENTLVTLKRMIRDTDVTYFSDDELREYYKDNNNNLNDTVYACLCIKAEDTTLSITGLTTGDTSKYYRRLAARYRPCNSGVLTGKY